MSAKTILIVDDQVWERRILRATLETAGHTVLEADDGVTAWEVLVRKPVDILLSDLVMPRMDGFQLCRKVRQHDELWATPFILYTGSCNSIADRQLAESLGTDVFLTKPAVAPTLVASLEEARHKAVRRPRAPLASANSNDQMKEYDAALVERLEERSAELERLNTTLHASEYQLRFLSDHLPMLIAHYDTELRYKFVNTSYAAQFGREPADVVGRHMRELVDEATFAQASPHMARVLAGERVEFECTLTASVTGPRNIFVTYIPERNATGQVVGFAAAILDITRRKQAEAHSKESEGLYHSLVEMLPQGVFRKDREGRFTFVNNTFCQTVNRPLAALLGRMDADLFPPALVAKYRADDLHVMEAGQPLTLEEVVIGADGQPIWLEVSKVPVRDAAGSVSGIQGTFTDITARRHTAAALSQRADELERFKDLSVGRELRMIELKQEVNELARLAGRPEPYDLSFLDRADKPEGAS